MPIGVESSKFTLPCPLCGVEVEQTVLHACVGTDRHPGKANFYFTTVILHAPVHKFATTERLWRKRRRDWEKARAL